MSINKDRSGQERCKTNEGRQMAVAAAQNAVAASSTGQGRPATSRPLPPAKIHPGLVQPKKISIQNPLVAGLVSLPLPSLCLPTSHQKTLQLPSLPLLLGHLATRSSPLVNFPPFKVDQTAVCPRQTKSSLQTRHTGSVQHIPLCPPIFLR